MKFKDPKEVVMMYGPAFDGSGRIVNRKVLAHDIHAYRQVGYEIGSVKEEEVEVLPAPVVTRSKKKK